MPAVDASAPAVGLVARVKALAAQKRRSKCFSAALEGTRRRSASERLKRGCRRAENLVEILSDGPCAVDRPQ
jgi:hypothetical protein